MRFNIRKSQVEEKERPEVLEEDNYDVFRAAPPDTEEESKKKKDTQSFFDLLKVNSKKENLLILLIAAATYLACFYFIGSVLLLIKNAGKSVKSGIELNPFHFPHAMLFSGSAAIFISTLILSLLIAWIAANRYMHHIKLRDNDYVIRSKRGIYGNADWMTNRPKELESTLDSTEDLKRPGYIPLGIYKDKAYSVPQHSTYDQFKNLNICIIGSSGIGKSFAFIGPLIQSRIAYGESFLVTDTKGDIYKTYAKVCEKFGYDVKVFNSEDWRLTDSWNCMQDIADAPESEIYNYVDAFTNVFIRNTSHGERPDFWMKSEHDLLRACMHLVGRDRSYEGRRTFSEMIDLINGPESEITAQLLAAEEKVQNAAANFISSSEARLRENYRAGLANRLQIFRSPIVKEALSVPGINFKDAVNRPTAIFLVTRDDNSAYDAITSLFISCLYSKLVEISKSEEYGNKLKVPFWIITDELCNMAAIDDFSKKISTNRSRNIRLCLAIQSLSQLDGTYVGLARNIISNCGIVTFLGSDEKDTRDYVVKRCGTYTQIVEQRRVERNSILRKLIYPLHYSEMKNEVKKNLIEDYETSQFETGRIIHMILGKSPFKGKSYPENMHEVFQYTEKANIFERHPAWYEDLCRKHPEFVEADGTKYTPSEYELEEDRKPAYTPQEKRIQEQFRKLPPEARYARREIMEEIAKKREQARLDSEERIRRQFEGDQKRAGEANTPTPVSQTVASEPSSPESLFGGPESYPPRAEPKTPSPQAAKAPEETPDEPYGDSTANAFDPFDGDDQALEELFG